MEERWARVPGFEDDYSVSCTGRVRRDSKGGNGQHGRILKPWINVRSGYACVSLHARDAVRKAYVHRLVLEAFVGPGDGRQCNHKDGNRQNNNLENLEWCSARENLLHAYAVLGRKRASCFPAIRKERRPRGSAHGMATLSEDTVRKMREYRALHPSESCQKIADLYGSKKGTVIDILSGKNWRHIL